MAAAKPRKAAARPAKAKAPAKKAAKAPRKATASASRPIRAGASRGKPAKGAKPAKRPRRQASAEPAAQPSGTAPAEDWDPLPTEAGWVPVSEAEAEAEAWAPVPDPTPAPVPPAAAARPFDPVTGDWLPVGAAAPSAAMPPGATALPEPAPEAAKRSTGATVWTVILGIDLAFLALSFLFQLAVGAIFLFAPDSARAEDLRERFGVGSPGALAAQQALTFLLMGVVPFLWVLGTRRVTWEGTKRYLHLHEPLKGVLRGIALTPLLLVAVLLLITAYTVATKGVDGLSLTESEEGQNPAVDAILAQLTWPVAILIAFTAGVGEEILFRGVLQRWVGLWGQAVVFGLAHAGGGFLPQILFAAGLGVFFGWLIRRGWSLWTLMTAHFLYDLALLGTSLVYG